MNIKKIIPHIFTLFVCACTTSKHSLHYFERLKMIQNNITPDFEKFDVTAFSTEKNALIASGYETKYNNTNGSIKSNLTSYGSVYIIKEYDENSNLIKETRKDDQIAIETDYLDEFMAYSRTFYSNGNIQNKGIGSWLGFNIGKQYLFNREGGLIEMKDNDIGYQFDYNQVFNFCKDHNIQLTKTTKQQSLKIRKSLESDHITQTWIIENPLYEVRQYEIFVLDGNTGNVLRSFKTPFISDGL